jgi:predicted dehydrogenase
MNILILGLGSIGQRHLRNLRTIDKNLKFFVIRKKFKTPLLNNKNKVIKGDINKKFNLTILKNIKELKFNTLKIHAAFICTPSKFHIKEAIELLKKDIHIFVEKPLGSNYKKISELENLIQNKPKIKHMMGYQLKFNPILIKLKKIIESEFLGKIYNVLIHQGEHLEDFHPYEDYTKLYAARKQLGGGVILTQIHEIDYILYLFDKYKIKLLNCEASKVSTLKINVEDHVFANFKLYQNKNKFICSLYQNYFERPKSRIIILIGEKGKIECDLTKEKIYIYKKNFFKKIDFKINRNQIYINQVRYFINCIKKNKKINKIYDVFNGIKSLRIALDMKKVSKIN